MDNNINEILINKGKLIGNYTKNAIKAFEEGIVNQENFLEKQRIKD
ncbi:hypothetical protein [Clostridium cylindrosporum]|uniref:Uncharacterized protein n=1 Tax=Clostridium cylindrosporum DSM 605 TaxID=1121307 RepID=A0A0J8D6Y2_CLOCY|nr:hypothetical protein [Clostridium cylindrosporum]KMT21627.1 hypothetical protein CLCY_2c03890 [Clostridium cylindrosporum DSM 605]